MVTRHQAFFPTFAPISSYTLSPIGKEYECLQLNLINFIVASDFTHIPANFSRLGFKPTNLLGYKIITAVKSFIVRAHPLSKSETIDRQNYFEND